MVAAARYENEICDEENRMVCSRTINIILEVSVKRPPNTSEL